MNVTRRSVLGGAASATALALTPVCVAAQAIEDVFRIADEPRNPNNFTYDVFAWSGSGYLAFADGNDIARWGDDNPPTGAVQREPRGLYESLVEYDNRDEELLHPDNLYTDLVRDVTVSQPIALLFFGLMAAFGFFSVKLRSVIIGAIWLFMVLSFVLAVLVGFSLEFFWITVVFATIATVASVGAGGG